MGPCRCRRAYTSSAPSSSGTDQSPEGQQLMLQYLADTESTGELPLYYDDVYDRALEPGTVPALDGIVAMRARK